MNIKTPLFIAIVLLSSHKAFSLCSPYYAEKELKKIFKCLNLDEQFKHQTNCMQISDNSLKEDFLRVVGNKSLKGFSREIKSLCSSRTAEERYSNKDNSNEIRTIIHKHYSSLLNDYLFFLKRCGLNEVVDTNNKKVQCKPNQDGSYNTTQPKNDHYISELLSCLYREPKLLSNVENLILNNIKGFRKDKAISDEQLKKIQEAIFITLKRSELLSNSDSSAGSNIIKLNFFSDEIKYGVHYINVFLNGKLIYNFEYTEEFKEFGFPPIDSKVLSKKLSCKKEYFDWLTAKVSGNILDSAYPPALKRICP